MSILKYLINRKFEGEGCKLGINWNRDELTTFQLIIFLRFFRYRIAWRFRRRSAVVMSWQDSKHKKSRFRRNIFNFNVQKETVTE